MSGSHNPEEYWYKQIVRALIHTNQKRIARIKAGKASEFDEKAAKAIEDTIDQVNVDTQFPEVRKTIIKKCLESIETDTPWELMGETYCGRSSFYAYRKRIIKLIAINLGIIEDTVTHSCLRRPEVARKGKA